MKTHFQLTRFDCFVLVANLLSFGACLVLIALRGARGPLVFLTVGSGLAAVAKLGMAYHRGSKSEAAVIPQVTDSTRPEVLPE